MFKANLFKAKLIEKGKTTSNIASAIGCNEVTLYRKINGTSDFTRNEIQLIKQELDISFDDVEAIFFA